MTEEVDEVAASTALNSSAVVKVARSPPPSARQKVRASFHVRAVDEK